MAIFSHFQFVTYSSVITYGEKITIMWRDPFKPVLEYVLSPIMFFFKTGSIILKYIITPAREKNLNIRKTHPDTAMCGSGGRKSNFTLFTEKTLDMHLLRAATVNHSA